MYKEITGYRFTYRIEDTGAEKNFLSKTAVWHRCINKLKDPYKLDGYNYQYER